MKRFRCAALSVVKHAYVAHAAAAHPRFELAVVADDPDRPNWTHERNQRFADQYGIPYVRDIARALADYGAEVAVVSPEAERHAELSIRAASAGLHVVQDKPMATSLTDADRIVDAVERAGVRFLLWNRNFLPAARQAREAVASGAVGRPYAVHVDFYFAKDAGPPRGSRRPDEPPRDWLAHQIAAHVDGSDGGLGTQPLGELQVEGIYPLAYVRLLTGATVRRVFARAASRFHQLHADHGVDDLASLSLEMDDGVLGTVCLGRIGAASHPNIGEIKIHLLGDRGGLVVNEPRPEVSVYYRGQTPLDYRQRRVGVDNDYLLMDDFAHAIDAGCDTALGVQAGRAITATVAAALESARTGRVVAVDDGATSLGSGGGWSASGPSAPGAVGPVR